MNKEIKPVRLRLELKSDYLSNYEKRMLKRYGESHTGDSIVREVLVPSDIPLHNLHYVIQKLFNWKNTHLRSFHLPKEVFENITEGTVKGWSEQVGVLFQPPSVGDGDLFWDDDYTGGNFKVWLKRKYIGPYVYGGTLEHYEAAQEDVQNLLKAFSMLEVRESFKDYSQRLDDDPEADRELKVLKTAPLIDLTLEEMQDSIGIDGNPQDLLERLAVDEILAAQGEEISEDQQFPVAHELNYRYDFGDDWEVKITKYDNYNDLYEKNQAGEEELKEAEDTVIAKHKPVCIHKEGLSVFDDIGGLGGYARFLGSIFEGEQSIEISQMRAWAKSEGWITMKMDIRQMI